MSANNTTLSWLRLRQEQELEQYFDGHALLQAFLEGKLDFKFLFADRIITHLCQADRDDYYEVMMEKVKSWGIKKLEKGQFEGWPTKKVFGILIARIRSYYTEVSCYRSKYYNKNNERDREWISRKAQWKSWMGEIGSRNEEAEVEAEVESLVRTKQEEVIRALEETYMDYSKEELEYLISKYNLNIDVKELYKSDFEVVKEGNQLLWDFDSQEGASRQASAPTPSTINSASIVAERG